MTEKVADSLPRWPIWFAGLLCTTAFLCLALQTKANTGVGLVEVLSAFVVVSVASLLLFVGASRGFVRLGVREVLFFALIFRLVGIWGDPVLEDDHFRYMWDGWMTLHQGTPYDSPPLEWFDSEVVPEEMEHVLDGINYPGVPTVYGPTAQLLFAAAAWIAPGSVLPLQIFAALADCLVLLLLARMAHVRWLLLYGWSFLLVKEFSFTAHIDVVGAGLLLWALWLRNQDQSGFWVGFLVGVFAAMALGIKAFAVIALPFLLQFDWRAWVGNCVGIAGLSIPFGFLPAWIPGGLVAMGEGWIFNAPAYLAALWVGQEAGVMMVRLIGIISFASVALWIGWKYLVMPRSNVGQLVSVQHYLPGMSWLWCALLLMSPVFNPWYLVWWLPLACLYPSRTAWACSFAVVLSYVTGLNLNDTTLFAYQQPTWILMIEFTTIGIALWLDWQRPLTRLVSRA
ncbi:MAG: hypothetical protein AAF541_14230 [Pseudomonadota bacterium]